jgi:hypothetical protein
MAFVDRARSLLCSALHVFGCWLAASSLGSAAAQITLTSTTPTAATTKGFVPTPRPVTLGGTVYYPYRFEGHIHSSPYSIDARHPPLEIMNEAERLGLDAIVLTDHGSSRGRRDFEKYHGPLVPFVGREIGGDFGHAVIWNVEADDGQVSSSTSLQQRCDFAHKHGGLLVWAHPGWWIEGNEHNPMEWLTPNALRKQGPAGDIDAIEIWNGVYRGPLPKLIDHWLRSLEAGVYVPVVGNSDFHRFSSHHIGQAHSIAFCDENDVRTCLWSAVREGRIIVSDGPYASLTVDGKLPGSILVGPTAPLTAKVEATAAEGGTLQLYVGRDVVQTLQLAAGERASASWTIPLPSADTYVRIDILRPHRTQAQTPISLLSNPVIVDVGAPRPHWR